MVLAALAGCVTNATVTNATLFDVPIDGVEMELEAHMDARGFLGHDKSVPNGITDINYTITIESPAPEDKVRRCKETIDRKSAVRDTLASRSTSRRGSCTSRAERGRMPGDVNCIFTKGLIPFVEKEVGPEGVSALCRTAGRSREYLMADHNWLPLGARRRAGPRGDGADGRDGRGGAGRAAGPTT